MGSSAATPESARIARLAVLFAALVVNAPVLTAGPIYDDHALVERNPLAHAPIQ